MKSNNNDKQKTVNEPWSAVQPYYSGQAGKNQPGRTGIFPEAERLYKNGAGFYTPFDPLQLSGQQGQLSYAQNFGSLYAPYLNASMGALNAPDLANNPYLEPYMQAATRPLEQQLQFSTMPGIRSQFTGAGQYGSSRQGVAEGVAQGLTNQAIGDTRAKIASQAYGQGLDQQARAMSLFPQVMQQGQVPYDIVNQIGALRQQMTNQQQTDPYKRLQEYANILSGGGNLGGTTTAPVQNPTSGAQDTAALMTALASMYSAWGGNK